jgi:glycosyltransferase involved in cell wall biosynthesis
MERHCLQCAREIEKGGFDILFANGDRDLLVAPIARHLRLPSVLYLQEPSRTLYEAAPTLPWVALPSPKRWTPIYSIRFLHNLIKVQGLRVLARQERESAKMFDTILVNSYFSMESVMRAYGLPSQVCYLGVDTSLFQPQNKERERFIISVGAITPAKGVETIIRAVALLEQPRPPLVWVGNTSIPAYLSAMRSLALSLGVDFEPRMLVPDQELVELLNRASVLAYAPFLEPFGFAPLEAGACALPTVAVAEGGVRETVRQGVNGLLVERKPEAIAEALSRVLDDPERAAQLGAAARELVEREWSLEGAVDRLEQRLLEVFEHKRREAAGTIA